MPSPIFERYGSWLGKTWSLRRFQRHHTEINQHYWSFVPAASYLGYVYKHSVDADTQDLLKFKGHADARRPSPKSVEWSADFREFQNWVRLGILLSSASYLEIYLSSVMNLTLRSDPLIRFGAARTIDGVSWVKRGIDDDFESHVRPCLIGRWPSRIAAFTQLFGSAPTILTNNAGELDAIRQLRNAVGHTFGRTITPTTDPLALGDVGTERLSAKRLHGWLSLIETVAVGVDQHLLSHIGEFELIWYYHRWQKIPRTGAAVLQRPARLFSQELASVTGNVPGRDFLDDVINYYNQL